MDRVSNDPSHPLCYTGSVGFDTDRDSLLSYNPAPTQSRSLTNFTLTWVHRIGTHRTRTRDEPETFHKRQLKLCINILKDDSGPDPDPGVYLLFLVLVCPRPNQVTPPKTGKGPLNLRPPDPGCETLYDSVSVNVSFHTWIWVVETALGPRPIFTH